MFNNEPSRRRGEIVVHVERRERPDIASLRRAVMATAIARLRSESGGGDEPRQEQAGDVYGD